MSLRFGMVRGAISLGSARVVGNLLGTISIIVLARLLTPEDFGIVAIASSILSIVQCCTELSLSSALIQKEVVKRSHIDTAWTMSLLRSLALVLIFLLLAWPLAEIYDVTGLVPVLLVSGVTGAVVGLQNPMITLVTKEMRFWPVAVTQLVQKGLSLGFAIALALMLHSYWAIIAGNALGAILATLLTYVLVPYRPRLSVRHAREIWSFSGWLFFNQLCATLNWRGDQLIIGAVVPNAQLGVYAMADNLAVIPSRETIHPIRQALFPGLANLNGDSERLRNASLLAQATLAMVIAPLGIILALVAEPAVKIALGEQWLSAIPFVQISALLYTFGCFSIALQPVAMAKGRTKILFLQQAAVLVFKFPMLIAGLIFGGLLGAALARCLAEFISVILELVAIKVLTGTKVVAQLLAHATTIIGLIAMSAGVYFLHQQLLRIHSGSLLQFGIEVTAGSAIYVAAVVTVWIASGRREGPVSELLHVAGRVAASIRGAALPRRPISDAAG